MQEKEITNQPNFSEIPSTGRIIALDLGTKKVGVAVCDELQLTVRGVVVVQRKSWKELLQKIKDFITEFDAVALVLGLPINIDETENEMSLEARRLHRNFSLSLKIPVFLQDERLTSLEAKSYLNLIGYRDKEVLKRIDTEAACLILNDFLELVKHRKIFEENIDNYSNLQ